MDHWQYHSTLLMEIFHEADLVQTNALDERHAQDEVLALEPPMKGATSCICLTRL